MPQQTRAEDNPFALATGQDLFGKLSETPDGEDPAYWPVHVLNELNHHILNRDHPGNERPGLWGISSREIGERFAPLQEHIRNVKTAYEILAYPHCKYVGRRENIEDELARDQQSFARDQVELSDDGPGSWDGPLTSMSPPPNEQRPPIEVETQGRPRHP